MGICTTSVSCYSNAIYPAANRSQYRSNLFIQFVYKSLLKLVPLPCMNMLVLGLLVALLNQTKYHMQTPNVELDSHSNKIVHMPTTRIGNCTRLPDVSTNQSSNNMWIGKDKKPYPVLETWFLQLESTTICSLGERP